MHTQKALQTCHINTPPPICAGHYVPIGPALWVWVLGRRLNKCMTYDYIKGHPKGARGQPKGAPREPKGTQRAPNGA